MRVYHFIDSVDDLDIQKLFEELFAALCEYLEKYAAFVEQYGSD